MLLEHPPAPILLFPNRPFLPVSLPPSLTGPLGQLLPPPPFFARSTHLSGIFLFLLLGSHFLQDPAHRSLEGWSWGWEGSAHLTLSTQCSLRPREEACCPGAHTSSHSTCDQRTGHWERTHSPAPGFLFISVPSEGVPAWTPTSGLPWFPNRLWLCLFRAYLSLTSALDWCCSG